MPDDRYYPVKSYQDDDGNFQFYEKEGENRKTYAINSRHLFKMPRVFSIFCHGTGGHRYGHCKELVTEFHSAYWDRGAVQDGGEAANEYYKKHYHRSFLILDGVGRSDHQTSAGPDGKDLGQMGPPHPMPGDFWPCSFEKVMKPSTSNTTRDFNHRVSEMWIDGHTGASKASGSQKHRGDVYGDGWNDNVAHALFVLNELLKEDLFPDVINLIGWSRGAVTTIKLSTAIHKFFVEGRPFEVAQKYEDSSQDLVEYPNLGLRHKAVEADAVALNVFAIDPVPGRFGKQGSWGGSDEIDETFPTVPGDQDYRSLPPIVKKCVITLAMDERRSGFAPLSAGQVSYGGDTEVVWLPFPGIHRTQLRMEPRDPKKAEVKALLKAVPHLVFDLAWKFMTSNGTVFKKNLLEEPKFGGGQLALEQIVELYSDVWLNRANYHETRNVEKILNYKWRKFTGYRGLGKKKKKYLGRGKNKYTVPAEKLFTENMRAYVDFPGIFINMHHQAAFERVYPNLYAFLTTPNETLDYSDDSQHMEKTMPFDGALNDELEAIFQGAPTSLQMFLEELGFGRQADQRVHVSLSKNGVEHYFVPGPNIAAPGKPLANATADEDVPQPAPVPEEAPEEQGAYNFAIDEEEEGDEPVEPAGELGFSSQLIASMGLLDYPEEEEEEGEAAEVEAGGA